MKKYFIILGSLQVFTALGAIPAGVLFLIDTSGRLMGMNPDFLSDSPLQSFLLPGLFLLIVNGLANAVAAFLSFSQKKIAAYAGILLGATLCIWIGVQYVWLTETSFLQPTIFIIGLLDIAAGWKILRSAESGISSD